MSRHLRAARSVVAATGDVAPGQQNVARRAVSAIMRCGVAAGTAAALFASAMGAAAADQSCKPRRPLARVVLTTMGPCGFQPENLRFSGDPVEQARCLVRPVAPLGKLGPLRQTLPAVLATNIGQAQGLPRREALSAWLSQLGQEWAFAAYLWRPVSRARDNDPTATSARYFVIHDTSGPNLGRSPWPTDLDDNWKINNLGRFLCSDGWEEAHVIINRSGRLFVGHDLEIPWRATKFERATTFGTDLKGLFLHVEMVQPRRSAPRRGRGNDAQAPRPGFTTAQYDGLALVYVVASVRAGIWLIPAFHAVIDTGIHNGHDDPQNFDLDAFARSVERVLDGLRARDQIAVSPDR